LLHARSGIGLLCATRGGRVIVMSGRTFNVLFLCTGNSARSILAECLLRQLGKGSFNGFSAGSFPKGEVHPLALRLLTEQGFFTEDLRSKSWNEFATPGAPVMDFVFTVCDQAAGEVCPLWPGQPVTAHWGIPDPAAVDGSEAEQMLAFREAFRSLERRLKIFVSLPIDKLDRIALTRRVEAIGRLRCDAAEGHAS
jgi:arsenate reductase (thioredoxin)